MDAPAEQVAKPDFADLRAELKTALSASTPTSPTAQQAGSPPAATAPTPEQAPETKPEATPTQQPTEPPSEEPAKPAETPDEDLTFAAKLAGVDPAVIQKIASADPDVASAARAIAQKAIEYNNRLAEQARLAKAPQAPAPPAQQSAADWTDETIEATVEAWVMGDPQRRIAPDRECASLSAQFDAEAKTIQEISAEVENLSREELVLRELMDAGRRARLGLPEADEYTVAEQKSRLRDIQTDLRNKEFDLRKHQERQARLHNAYHQRKESVRHQMRTDRENERRARQQQQDVEEKASRYEQSWRGAIGAVFDELKVRPDIREKAFNFARRTALAEGAPDESDLKTWMTATVKEFLEPVSMSHRAMEGEYAATKIADAKTFGAPATSLIPPKPASAPGDFRTDIRNEMRRRFGA